MRFESETDVEEMGVFQLQLKNCVFHLFSVQILHLKAVVSTSTRHENRGCFGPFPPPDGKIGSKFPCILICHFLSRNQPVPAVNRKTAEHNISCPGFQTGSAKNI